MSYLTAPVADPMEALTIASDAGYDGLGLRLHGPLSGEPASPLVTDPGLRAAFRARMGELGLCITEIEACLLRREKGDPTDPRVFETAAELGARRLVSVADLPGAVTVGELCDRFADLCRAAAEHGLSAGFEPIAYRAGGMPGAAMQAVEAGRDWGAGLVLDALHVHRMGMTPQQLGQVDQALLEVFHICDAPADAGALQVMIDHSAFNRMLPGDGELPLAAYLRALPPEFPISLEIPMVRLQEDFSPAERARLSLERTRALLRQVEG